jgi:hypothetical protein
VKDSQTINSPDWVPVIDTTDIWPECEINVTETIPAGVVGGGRMLARSIYCRETNTFDSANKYSEDVNKISG